MNVVNNVPTRIARIARRMNTTGFLSTFMDSPPRLVNDAGFTMHDS
jgi:hypothetical protein